MLGLRPRCRRVLRRRGCCLRGGLQRLLRGLLGLGIGSEDGCRAGRVYKDVGREGYGALKVGFEVDSFEEFIVAS